MTITKSRGFTLLELIIVITLMTLLLAIIAPNMVAVNESRRQRDFMLSLRMLAAETREHAIASGLPSMIRLETGRLELVEMGEDENTLRRLDLLAGISVERLRTGGVELNSSDWQVVFYPDGSTDGGDLQFARGRRVFTLVIDAQSSRSSIVDGAYEAEPATWEAGDYERRG